MTKDQWANYLKPWAKGYGDDNRINALALADRILAALDQERAGEVVLGDGAVQQLNGNPCVDGIPVVSAINKYLGKRGTLIFREQEGK